MLGTMSASVKSALQRAGARLRELALATGQITEPIAPRARALLDQYIAAFENADALERLLMEDATLEATPAQASSGSPPSATQDWSLCSGSGRTWREQGRSLPAVGISG